MNRPLMRAVIEYALFLGLGNDTFIDPDAAVSQLEQLSWILKELTPPEQGKLISFIQEMADQEPRDTRSQKRIELLLSLADNLGITSHT